MEPSRSCLHNSQRFNEEPRTLPVETGSSNASPPWPFFRLRLIEASRFGPNRLGVDVLIGNSLPGPTLSADSPLESAEQFALIKLCIGEDFIDRFGQRLPHFRTQMVNQLLHLHFGHVFQFRITDAKRTSESAAGDM